MSDTPSQDALEIVALIEEALETHDEMGRRIMLGIFDRFCAEHPDTPKRPTAKATPRPPMKEADAKSFEHREMPDTFHKYAGTPVSETPIWYLCAIVKPHPFIVELSQYLTSERGQRRIDEPEES